MLVEGAGDFKAAVFAILQPWATLGNPSQADLWRFLEEFSFFIGVGVLRGLRILGDTSGVFALEDDNLFALCLAAGVSCCCPLVCL